MSQSGSAISARSQTTAIRPIVENGSHADMNYVSAHDSIKPQRFGWNLFIQF